MNTATNLRKAMRGMRHALSSTSPAIDVGDPAADYSKEPAPNGSRLNLGAYGNTTEAALTKIRSTMLIMR